MQVILGGGGPIGTHLAKSLKEFTQDIRITARNPKKVNEDDDLVSADLLDPGATDRAVEGCEVAYLTVGLKYDHKVWAEQWPVVIKNVIDACVSHGTKLVFFDNIYMYQLPLRNPMTEEHPWGASSKKGKVRTQVVNMIWEATKTRGLNALVARSGDFFGPGIEGTSVLTETVIKPLSAGQTANWLGNVDKIHTFTYVPEAAWATAKLGNSDDCYGETWHLPTPKDQWNGKQWVQHFAKEMGKSPKMRKVPKWMVKMMGWFIPVMKESVEMLYQFQQDYVFDSSKFEKRFDYAPIKNEDAVRRIVELDGLKKG
jgi:nucleoside-diphosphate-sugar epimerase